MVVFFKAWPGYFGDGKVQGEVVIGVLGSSLLCLLNLNALQGDLFSSLA